VFRKKRTLEKEDAVKSAERSHSIACHRSVESLLDIVIDIGIKESKWRLSTKV
jgi:hypothetical protein